METESNNWMALRPLFTDADHKDFTQIILFYCLFDRNTLLALRLLCKRTKDIINKLGSDWCKNDTIWKETKAEFEKKIDKTFEATMASNGDLSFSFCVDSKDHGISKGYRTDHVSDDIHWNSLRGIFFVTSALRTPNSSPQAPCNLNHANIFRNIVNFPSDETWQKAVLAKRLMNFLIRSDSVRCVSIETHLWSRSKRERKPIKDWIPKDIDLDLIWLYKFFDNEK